MTDGGGGLDFLFPAGITVHTGWRYRTDRSDISRDPAAVIQRTSLQNNIYSFGFRWPVSKWTLQSNYSTSKTRNESVFLPGVTIGGFMISTWSANVSGPLVKNTDFSFRYLRNVSRFQFPFSRRVYEQVGGRVNANGLLNSKLDLFLNINATASRGVAQIEFAREVGTGTRWRISSEKSLELQYQHIVDHFDPAETTLDHDADILELRYTALF